MNFGLSPRHSPKHAAMVARVGLVRLIAHPSPNKPRYPGLSGWAVREETTDSATALRAFLHVGSCWYQPVDPHLPSTPSRFALPAALSKTEEDGGAFAGSHRLRLGAVPKLWKTPLSPSPLPELSELGYTSSSSTRGSHLTTPAFVSYILF